MTAVVECPPILGTGQQIEYLQQAEAAARLSGLASNAASLCHALARGVAPERLQLLIERTRAFSEVVSRLDSGKPRPRSYSALIPFEVWRESTGHGLGESSGRVAGVLADLDRCDLDQARLVDAAEYFRTLADKLADRGTSSVSAAQDSLRD